jgi:hypothetical protein
MQKRPARLLLFVALSIMLTTAGQLRRVAAQATTFTDSETVPVEFVQTACNGETIQINGEGTVLLHLTASEGGQSVSRFLFRFHLEGLSVSGQQYIANEEVTSTFTGDPETGPFTFTSVGHLTLVAQGSADNLIVRTIMHTTINANGEITSVVFEFHVDCQG